MRDQCTIPQSTNFVVSCQNPSFNSLNTRSFMQRGTNSENSNVQGGLAAKWRNAVKLLSHRDRAGAWRRNVKKRGSVVIADVEALTCVKDTYTVATVAGAGTSKYRKTSEDQSLQEQQTRSPRSHQSNRLLRREKERLIREKVRERRLVTRLLATRVSPSVGGESGGTGMRKTVTTSEL